MSSSGANLDLFEAGSFLGKAFFFLFLFPLITVFIVGDQFGDRRGGVRNRFNQVYASFGGHFKGFRGAKNTQTFVFFVKNSNFLSSNFAI